jgi:hypothetical protein
MLVQRVAVAMGLLVCVASYSACSGGDEDPNASSSSGGASSSGASSGSTSSGGSNGGPNGLASNGKQDNGETDIDCGGPSAPACVDGKKCEADTDCTDKWCKPETKQCVVPKNDDGFKNGTETDVDCGGESGKKCEEGKACANDPDCTGACSYDKKCVDAPSCKNHFGGDTCGTKSMWPGELGDSSAAAKNENCCRTFR